MAEAQLAVDLAGNHMFLDDLYKKRVARLTASAVSIMVGGVSDLDVKEKMDRYDDAIRAMQAAIKDGIVPGGGVSLLRAQVQELPGDFGSTLLNKALFEVYRTILRNASIEDTSLKDILTKEKKYYRIDKDTLEISVYNSIKESRVIDPFMVVYEALRTSVSIATNILLTEGLIVRAAQVLNPNLDEIPV
jgi:chaperonin GroEL